MQLQLQQPMTIRIQQLSSTEVSITFEPKSAAYRVPGPEDPDYDPPFPKHEVQAALREGLHPREISRKLSVSLNRVMRERKRLQEPALAF